MAAAAPPPGPPAAAAAAVTSCMLLPLQQRSVFTTLPSLLGWAPAAAPAAGTPSRGCGRASSAATAAAGAARQWMSTHHQPQPPPQQQQPAAALSDSVAITPAIQAQLERIRQRHADVLAQLSGDAMSK